MDALIDLLIHYGYWGMLTSALLAGSVLPFSSEAVMLGLMAAGLNPWQLALYGTIGNVAGSMVNYGIGRLGKPEWSLDKAERFMAGHGAWMGFFAFLPIIGSAITVSLGLMRANIVITFTSITLGKVVRYILLIYGVGLLF